MFGRKISYEVWYDLKTFYGETLEDESTPELKRKDAREIANKYRTNESYTDAYMNVRVVKVCRTKPRWLNWRK